MGVFHTAAGQNVLAEEASGEELITIVPEETEAPETAETSSEEAGSTMPEETEVTETPETAGQQTTEKASETVETETDQEVVIPLLLAFGWRLAQLGLQDQLVSLGEERQGLGFGDLGQVGFHGLEVRDD